MNVGISIADERTMSFVFHFELWSQSLRNAKEQKALITKTADTQTIIENHRLRINNKK
jgi:hypothetical protein